MEVLGSTDILAVTKTIIRSVGLADSSDRDKHRIYLRPGDQFLHIFDLDRNADGIVQFIGTFQPPDVIRDMPQEVGLQIVETNVGDTLRSLRTLASRAVRIYIEHDFDHVNAFTQHVENLNLASFTQVYNNPSRRGYEALASQWTARTPRMWCESPSFVPVSQHQSTCHSGGTEIFSRSLLQTVKQACVLETRAGNLIKYEEKQRKTTRIRALLHEYVEILLDTGSQYQSLLRQSTPLPVCKKVLLLWHYHAQLIQLCRFTSDVQKRYFHPRQTLMDFRKSSLGPRMMNEMTADAYLYEELARISSDFTSVLDSLINAAAAGFESHKDRGGREFKAVAADVRGICLDLNTRVAGMTKAVEDHLRFLQLKREIRQSNAIWMLSVLAMIFLPLSLASGVLGMQTRFVELHFILYDFCGVVVFVLTLVGILLFTIWLSLKLGDSLASSHYLSIFRRLSKPALWTVSGLMVATIWGVVVSSFIIGMSQDAVLGGKILGLGLGGCIGSGIIACIIGWIDMHIGRIQSSRAY